MCRIGQGTSCPFLYLISLFIFFLFSQSAYSQDTPQPQSGQRCKHTPHHSFTGNAFGYGVNTTEAATAACRIHNENYSNFACRNGNGQNAGGAIQCTVINVCVTDEGTVPTDDQGNCPTPPIDCPEAGTAYGELGHLCSVSGLISDIFTPVTSFALINPNNPTSDPEGDRFCTISRESLETTSWVFDGPAFESGLQDNIEVCPPVDEDDGELDPDDPRIPPDPDPDPDPDPEPEPEPEVGGLEDPNYPNDPTLPNEPNEPEPHAPTADLPPDDEGFDISVSSDCSVAPICNGDASQCAGVFQIYESNCGSDAKNKANTEDIIDAIVDRTDRSQDEQEAEDALEALNEDLSTFQKAFDEGIKDLDDRRAQNLSDVDSLGTSESDFIDGTDLTQPDWLEGVLPSSGGCQRINYNVAGYSGQFPTNDGCQKLGTFRIIFGWALYLYLIMVAVRTFTKTKAG